MIDLLVDAPAGVPAPSQPTPFDRAREKWVANVRKNMTLPMDESLRTAWLVSAYDIAYFEGRVSGLNDSRVVMERVLGRPT